MVFASMIEGWDTLLPTDQVGAEYKPAAARTLVNPDIITMPVSTVEPQEFRKKVGSASHTVLSEGNSNRTINFGANVTF